MAEKNIVQQPSQSLWRNRAYTLLWSGQVISGVGTEVSNLAIPLLVLFLTHSPAQAGLVGALAAFPYVVFSLPAGALVDRWDRKRTMILCDSGRALALGSIPLAYALGHLTFIQLCLVALIEGTLFTFFNLAEVASLPQIVSKEQFPAVAARTEFTNSISSLAGRALGGILYSLGRFWPFLADAISYLISVVSLGWISVPFQGERQRSQRKLWAEIWEGIHWLWQQPFILFLALLGNVVHIVGASVTLIVIVIAQTNHVSAFLIGLILGVGGLGTLLGALLGGIVQKRWPFSWLLLGTQWVMTLLLPLYLLGSNTLWLAVVGATFFGTITLYGVVQFSYRLARIPDVLQGRVNSVFRLIVFGGDPIGLALTGVLLQAWGVRNTLLLYTAALLLLALISTSQRSIRCIHSLDGEQQPER